MKSLNRALLSRREFFLKGAVSCAFFISGAILFSQGTLQKRKMKISLNCGNIGVDADLKTAVKLAKKYGFEAVDPSAGAIAAMNNIALNELRDEMRQSNIVWGASGLPVDFRGDEMRFKDGLAKLPDIASKLKLAGIERISTWISPTHQTMDYAENFKFHKQRLSEIAKILKDNGLRFGIEYVGTMTSLQRGKYKFIHSMSQLLELINEIGQDNVGVVLDSWHWWQAGETAQDILKLKNKNVVVVDLNDAPAGIEKDKQIDNRRKLPAETGVIDVKSFLGALVAIGFDGPVRAEPFDKELNALNNDSACAATIKAMRKAFSLVS